MRFVKYWKNPGKRNVGYYGIVRSAGTSEEVSQENHSDEKS